MALIRDAPKDSMARSMARALIRCRFGFGGKRLDRVYFLLLLSAALAFGSTVR